MLFSGRPDPTWWVDEDLSQRLQQIWEGLLPFLGRQPLPPMLGYRGCFLRHTNSNREWYAFAGVVELKGQETSILRQDPQRAFERLLLASAPEGSVPLHIIDKVW